MAAATYDHMQDYPDSPIDSDEQAYPCKGCGKILEEGKAFELAGNRWHIDCFRCNTCDTLLDSDANLLLLGDGSLICNNCTYSCSNCGNKIEDLAILTGDQAFCANCFKCRSCKRKIENLRYARTSQGIFCMDCHEALMARRRKKTARGQNHRSKNANIDKSLPAIPPPEARHTAYLTPGADSMYNDSYIPTTPELPTTTRKPSDMRSDQESDGSRPPTSTAHYTPAGLTLPSTTYRDNDRQSYESQKSEMSGAGMASGAEEFLIPLAFDPNPPKHSATTGSSINTPKMTEERPKDYFNRSGSHGQQSSISQTSSPHIAYQDKSSKSVHEARQDGRTGSTPASPLIQHEPVQSPHISQLARNDTEQTERFKLQDPPKTSRVPSQTSTPRADITPASTHIGKSFVAELEAEPVTITPRKTPEPSPSVDEATDPFKTAQNNVSKVRDLPKRGDSLEGSKRQQTIPRKEITPTATVPPAFPDTANSTGTSARGTSQSIDLEKANGGKVISAPIISSESQNLFEASSKRQQLGDTKSESFVEPRVPPAPPENAHTRNESISTAQSEAHVKASPKLPHYSAGGDFTMDEDMARILASGEEAPSHGSFLRKVSNSVRHARSHSDKSGRISRDRWPKSPVTTSSAAAGQDISSPSTSSPEHREELAWFKNELQRERQRTLVREKKISELEAQINSAADISQVNVELREKRSTMVVLDTQKEMVVRELEVLTEHIAKAKKSGEPLDMGKMNSAALRDLAESLQKLKDSFAPQIESLTQKRNDLLEEIAHLTSSKDKSFQEFEQLSNKNAQLAEFNNQLVDQIQNIYKNNRAPTTEEGKPNGLGIYSHHKEKSSISIDARDIRPLIQTQYPLDPNATFEAGEAGAAQSLGGVHMVEMKKGAVAKRFDWRKGQKMAKGLTKNVKGAFTSAQQNYGREMQFAETGAYGIGGTQGGQEYSALPRNNQEPLKQGWFGGQRPQGKNGMYQGNGNDSTPSLLADAGAQLFGSDLTQRVEYERASIPGIVKRCIQEVEARGMDVEGIYRKSGGNSQVQQVKDGFERQPSDYDISDQDLDIHAVTSGLKQYFRKLPSPLITYDCYDRLIELTKIPEGPDRKAMRIQGLRDALDTLPKVHYDTLDYLMRHLSRVVVLEKENLMTPMNVAVVFAPTIMRPESVARELSDTKAKNEVVMWMVQECDKVFD